MGKGNAAMALLTDKNKMQLILMGPQLTGNIGTPYPGAFHIGFRQDSEEEVDRINAAMNVDGIDVPAPSKIHGAWTIFYRSPWGVMIEVVA